MNEEQSTQQSGNKVVKFILGLVAVFVIFTISTLVIAVNPSMAPFALLIAAVVSIFTFKKIIK
jgi:uncharacterized membrane protein YciS (DUF1049 family)